MVEKVKQLLGSVRFWMATFAWASAYLAGVTEHGFSWAELFDQVSKWLGTVVAVGSLDSIAEKVSPRKPTPPPAVD